MVRGIRRHRGVVVVRLVPSNPSVSPGSYNSRNCTWVRPMDPVSERSMRVHDCRRRFQRCIDHCKQRFVGQGHVQFHVNDGVCLAFVPDNSIDFVFSFDSLVHVEIEVIGGILPVGSKIRPDGVGFIHHSNLAAYPRRLAIMNSYNQLPATFRRRVLTHSIMETILSVNIAAWRATSVSAEIFRRCCESAGLKCISQELINWHRGRCLIDCMSVFSRGLTQHGLRRLVVSKWWIEDSGYRCASRRAVLPLTWQQVCNSSCNFIHT